MPSMDGASPVIVVTFDGDLSSLGGTPGEAAMCAAVIIRIEQDATDAFGKFWEGTFADQAGCAVQAGSVVTTVYFHPMENMTMAMAQLIAAGLPRTMWWLIMPSGSQRFGVAGVVAAWRVPPTPSPTLARTPAPTPAPANPLPSSAGPDVTISSNARDPTDGGTGDSASSISSTSSSSSSMIGLVVAAIALLMIGAAWRWRRRRQKDQASKLFDSNQATNPALRGAVANPTYAAPRPLSLVRGSSQRGVATGDTDEDGYLGIGSTGAARPADTTYAIPMMGDGRMYVCDSASADEDGYLGVGSASAARPAGSTHEYDLASAVQGKRVGGAPPAGIGVDSSYLAPTPVVLAETQPAYAEVDDSKAGKIYAISMMGVDRMYEYDSASAVQAQRATSTAGRGIGGAPDATGDARPVGNTYAVPVMGGGGMYEYDSASAVQGKWTSSTAGQGVGGAPPDRIGGDPSYVAPTPVVAEAQPTYAEVDYGVGCILSSAEDAAVTYDEPVAVDPTYAVGGLAPGATCMATVGAGYIFSSAVHVVVQEDDAGF